MSGGMIGTQPQVFVSSSQRDSRCRAAARPTGPCNRGCVVHSNRQSPCRSWRLRLTQMYAWPVCLWTRRGGL